MQLLPWIKLVEKTCKKKNSQILQCSNIKSITRMLRFKAIFQPLKLKSGVDFFYIVCSSISFDVKKVEIRTSTTPDRKSTFLNIKIETNSKGTGHVEI